MVAGAAIAGGAANLSRATGRASGNEGAGAIGASRLAGQTGLAGDPASAAAAHAFHASVPGRTLIGGAARRAVGELRRARPRCAIVASDAIGVEGARRLASRCGGAHQAAATSRYRGTAGSRAIARLGRQCRARAGGSAGSSLGGIAAFAGTIAETVESAGGARGRARAVGHLARRNGKALSIGLPVQSLRAGRASTASLVAADAIGYHARRAFEGLNGRHAVRLRRRARAAGGTRGYVAVVAGAAVGLLSTSLQTAGRRALKGSAVLRRGRCAGAGSVTIRRERVGLVVGAARRRSADVARAHIAAGSRAVAHSVVAALIGRCLVRAEVVWILAAGDRGAGAVFLAGEGLLASVASGAGGLATHSIHAVAESAVGAKRALRAKRQLQRSIRTGLRGIGQSSTAASTATGRVAAGRGAAAPDPASGSATARASARHATTAGATARHATTARAAARAGAGGSAAGTAVSGATDAAAARAAVRCSAIRRDLAARRARCASRCSASAHATGVPLFPRG